MTLQQIHYVLTIAETGTIKKASEVLFMSQPALTSAIKELEAELNIQIFQRTNRGVTLTANGIEFLQRARHLYQEFELLQSDYIGGAQRKIFGVSTQHYSFVVKAFVETVKKFEHSNIQFLIKETSTASVIQDVRDQKSQIGILYLSSYNQGFLKRKLLENHLDFHPLIRCGICVYLWKRHPLAHHASISLKQLADYPHLTFWQGEESSAFYSEEVMDNQCVDKAKVLVSDRATMLNLMKGLNGYTLCSGIICEELGGSAFTAIPLSEDDENKRCVMEIGYIQPHRLAPSEVCAAFLEEMKNYLSQIPPK